MYFISEQEVINNFHMDSAIEAVRVAFTELHNDEASASSRERLRSSSSILNTMPATLNKFNISGLKVYSASKKGESFLVILFNNDSSKPIAVIEANRLGQMRTGALTAFVTSILRKECGTFTLLGSGFQAETQLEGMIQVFDPDEIRVYSRNPIHLSDFVQKMERKFGKDLKKFSDVRSAVEGADVISTITSSVDPFLKGSYLPKKCHINLAGANVVPHREADLEVYSKADLVVVEHLEQSLRESSEVVDFLNSGGEVKELRQIVLEPKKYSGFNRTVFKSMGIGLEDIASGYLILSEMGLI